MFEDQEGYSQTKKNDSPKLAWPAGLKSRDGLVKFLPVVVLIIVLIVVFILGRVSAPGSETVSASSGPSLESPISMQNVNKPFNFAVKDDKGNPIGSLEYTIQSAELDDQIVVQGQKVQSLPNRVFLVINLKITNNNKQNIQMNTRNYVRLTVNGDNSELLAPDIHNDPVEIQAISTKFTKIGFALNTTDKNFKLLVGEIDGPKTTISLSLHK